MVLDPRNIYLRKLFCSWTCTRIVPKFLNIPHTLWSKVLFSISKIILNRRGQCLCIFLRYFFVMTMIAPSIQSLSFLSSIPFHSIPFPSSISLSMSSQSNSWPSECSLSIETCLFCNWNKSYTKMSLWKHLRLVGPHQCHIEFVRIKIKSSITVKLNTNLYNSIDGWITPCEDLNPRRISLYWS